MLGSLFPSPWGTQVQHECRRRPVANSRTGANFSLLPSPDIARWLAGGCGALPSSKPAPAAPLTGARGVAAGCPAESRAGGRDPSALDAVGDDARSGPGAAAGGGLSPDIARRVLGRCHTRTGAAAA